MPAQTASQRKVRQPGIVAKPLKHIVAKPLKHIVAKPLKHIVAKPLKHIVALLGPTASGKTDLAVALARELPLHLISVDSVMIYRGLDIGSAKPSPQLLRQYPHALIDILDPAQAWSAADFVSAAVQEVKRARTEGKIPLLVGGAMLYFHALLVGLAQLPPANAQFRHQLRQRAKRQGWDVLHAELVQCDPVLARRVHPADALRIERGLEVFALTAKPLSELQRDTSEPALNTEDVLLLGLNLPRQELHSRIDRRLDEMLRAGLVREVQQLHSRGDLHDRLPAVRSIGYRHMWRWLEAGQPASEFDAAVEAIRAATRTYVRRQENWMRRFKGLRMNVSFAEIREQIAAVSGGG